MSRVVLTELAARDLESIGDFIAQDSVASAERVLDYLGDQLKLISLNPAIGRERPDLWAGVLCFTVGRTQWRSRFLIFYRRIEGGIEVARIIEGHRNILPALENPPGESSESAE
jgi:toxin ParE1/3/4